MAEQKVGVNSEVEKLPKQDPLQGGKSSIGGGIFEIKVYGHLDQEWSEWLGGLQITPEDDGNTLLSGIIPDQAALHGLLVKMRDLGLPILALKCVEN
jgi:hypothetical protein